MVRAFNGWVPPDSGTDQDASHFGGGVTDYDAEYAAQAAAFLRAASAKSSKPFALVVALANPHDIMGFPSTWDAKSLSDVAPYKGSSNYGDDTPGCVEQGIDLPSTVDEETARNHKPGAQARSVVMWTEGLGPLATLAGVPSRGKWTLKGADLMPVVNDATLRTPRIRRPSPRTPSSSRPTRSSARRPSASRATSGASSRPT